ncbi:16S rRNA (cytosine(967)-C(5))-methyltransferase [Pseudoxanthomonas broegbernensis]|uniref:16S rRNA (cytosine(967)-C(5))-methyltransferase n=1 Tax=Pseudoxanthomonas broegbernensis TaxID=83619 RepID=A0A7V8K621_9GAMM|nr:16S rRNA (cytosine(967)-C(5))-methyltransferase RsmB [Pseudoxanthomonas broegbernensis]KAF1685237.1 16S rRNA (cytosine(967)-C(5))-methyltransferase [Pseudoxanthomonas broegbernensis]MBB6066123.1 16S rRNA (cytosine967-C5)-methyltransferase [Pseudoxanthomonas broegbernensis]
MQTPRPPARRPLPARPDRPLAPGVEVRVHAAQVLDAVVHRGRSLKSELAPVLPRLPDPRDRALLEAIVFAALRGRHRYVPALRGWLQKPPGAGDGPLMALLLAGCAQLDALQLAAHAALDATVEAARALGRPHQAGLVNALLRRAQREGFPSADPAAAWPDWLRTRVAAAWPAQAAQVFAASAQPAPLWLRVNRRRIGRDDYRALLDAAGIASAVDPRLADALRLDAPVPVAGLPGFDAGLAAVQDGSAQQAVDALAAEPGARVLDACAAPGGKAAHLLERDPTLELLALDADPRRLARVEDNLRRSGVAPESASGRVQVRAGDATVPAQWWDGFTFDAVLLDAPCSATGVVRRQPDILLHRRAQDIDALVQAQARLLDAVWPVLRPGGVLLYATCSILPEENAGQIAAFLARTPDASATALGEAFGHAAGAGRQRLTGEDGLDGFFYARLRKAC